MLGGVEVAFGSGFRQELAGAAADGFGAGESCGQRNPGGVGQDAVGVVGDGRTKVLLEAAGGCGTWCAEGEVRQGRCGGLLVGNL